MISENADLIMWIFVIVMIVGFIMIYYQLSNCSMCKDLIVSKYDGLIIAVIGLIGGCYVGVQSGKVENFLKL